MNLLELINRDGITLLKRALELEEEQLQKYNSRGWKISEIGAPPSVVKTLENVGLIHRVYESRSMKLYAIKDRERAREVIEEYERKKESYSSIEIPEDLFSVVEGHEDVIAVIKKALEATLNHSRPVHVLLWGKPASGKSIILEELRRIGGCLVIGSHATRAGLFDLLYTWRPRVLMIDEIDKMPRKEFPVLLSLMETGFIKEVKYGRVREAQLSTMVIAAANRISRLPEELLSRFHFKFYFEEYSKEDFIRVATNVLVKREGLPEDLARYIAEKAALRTRDVREVIGLARIARTKEEVDALFRIKDQRRGPSSINS